MKIGGQPATLLEFLSASAWTKIVASHFGLHGFGGFTLIYRLPERDPVFINCHNRLRNLQCNFAAAGRGFGQLVLVRPKIVLSQKTDRAIPLVGVGGIMRGEDAWEMICSGASLIQVYTGFIYGGPLFVKRLNRYISNQLKQSGLTHLCEAVGMNV